MNIKNVVVFKTNVQNVEDKDHLLKLITDLYPRLRVNFDLDDCDRILRIEGEAISAIDIAVLLWDQGYECERLE